MILLVGNMTASVHSHMHHDIFPSIHHVHALVKHIHTYIDVSHCHQIIKRLGEGLTTTNDARRVDEGAWINKLCHKNSLYKEPDHSNRRILTYNGGLTHWGYNTYIHTYIDVSHYHQIIKRPREGITTMNDARHVVEGACGLHPLIWIKKCAIKIHFITSPTIQIEGA